jgi:hypothetical protein
MNRFVHARILRALFACFQIAGRRNFARVFDYFITVKGDGKSSW